MIIGKKELLLLWKQLDLALNLSACNITYITLSKPKLSRYKLQCKDFYILNAYSLTQIWILSLPEVKLMSSRLTLCPVYIIILNDIEELVSSDYSGRLKMFWVL